MTKAAFSLKPKGTGHVHPAAEQLAAKAAKQKQARLNVSLDEDTYKAFKLASMKQGKTVTGSIKEYIDSVIASSE